MYLRPLADHEYRELRSKGGGGPGTLECHRFHCGSGRQTDRDSEGAELSLIVHTAWLIGLDAFPISLKPLTTTSNVLSS